MGRIQTNVTKERISQSLTKYHPPFTKTCPECSNLIVFKDRRKLRRSERLNQTCVECRIDKEITNGHFSKMGRKSMEIQSKNRRSKNEVYFADLCKERFSNVETNKPLFNGWDADVIIHDRKIAVLWNGIWHRKKIKSNHSVAQVKNRDKIKMNEIVSCGYTPYIVEDDGKESVEFVETEFNKFLLTLQ